MVFLEKYEINRLADEIKKQADRLFPTRTDQSMFLKMYGEIAEMINAPNDSRAGEVADVFIMLLDYAARKEINLQDEILEKMKINESRVWKQTNIGVFQHVE